MLGQEIDSSPERSLVTVLNPSSHQDIVGYVHEAEAQDVELALTLAQKLNQTGQIPHRSSEQVC